MQRHVLTYCVFGGSKKAVSLTSPTTFQSDTILSGMVIRRPIRVYSNIGPKLAAKRPTVSSSRRRWPPCRGPAALVVVVFVALLVELIEFTPFKRQSPSFGESTHQESLQKTLPHRSSASKTYRAWCCARSWFLCDGWNDRARDRWDRPPHDRPASGKLPIHVGRWHVVARAHTAPDR